MAATVFAKLNEWTKKMNKKQSWSVVTLDDEYEFFEDNILTNDNKRATWQEARAACQKQGADLYSFTSEKNVAQFTESTFSYEEIVDNHRASC